MRNEKWDPVMGSHQPNACQHILVLMRGYSVVITFTLCETTPIFELGLQFYLDYTPVKFHVCLSHCDRICPHTDIVKTTPAASWVPFLHPTSLVLAPVLR